MPVHFGDEVAGTFEFKESVEPVVFFVDRIGEAFAAPFFQRADLAAVFHDEFFDFFDDGVNLGVIKRRIDDKCRLVNLVFFFQRYVSYGRVMMAPSLL